MSQHLPQTGFSRITEALSDPAREAIVSALSDGKAMPAGELAALAGISPQSASAHLQKLVDARVLSVWSQGRFRYYRIANDDVAALIESLVDLAVKADELGGRRARLPGALRQSRSCYRHLAGQLGVAMCEGLIRRNLVAISDRAGYVTEKGFSWCKAERIDFNPACGQHVRLCNDWTERVPHFAGPFPCAILKRLVEDRCVVRSPIPRALRLTPKGRAFFARLGAQVPY